MLRGLCKNWKQPVFFSFDFSFSKEKFLELLLKIQANNLIPIGVVCDYSPQNRALLKILNITPENSFFTDPLLQHPLFCFADFSHMLKLLRNHVFDHGISLNSGYFLSKTIFERILALEQSELKICFKISKSHLLVQGPERQNVRKAAQLFSNTVGNFILEFLPSETPAGNFILLIDKLFDLFNSTIEINNKNSMKAGFCGSIEQMNLLLVAYNEINTLRVGRASKTNNLTFRKNLLPFQIGILQSINSLIKLFEYVKINFSVRYLLTFKLTQDCLQIFFSQIRSMGYRYDNPTPLEFLYRFRILAFTKNFQISIFLNLYKQKRFRKVCSLLI